MEVDRCSRRHRVHRNVHHNCILFILKLALESKVFIQSHVWEMDNSPLHENAGKKLCFLKKPKKFPTFQQHRERLMASTKCTEEGGKNIIQLACSSCICLFLAFLTLFFPPCLFSSWTLSPLKEVELVTLPASTKSVTALSTHFFH